MKRSEFVTKLRKLYVEKTNKYGYIDLTEEAVSEIIEEIKDVLTLEPDDEVVNETEA